MLEPEVVMEGLTPKRKGITVNFFSPGTVSCPARTACGLIVLVDRTALPATPASVSTAQSAATRSGAVRTRRGAGVEPISTVIIRAPTTAARERAASPLSLPPAAAHRLLAPPQ
eukprot:scaffold17102_cov39-Tisochrysis_lutea.AAC.1